MPLDTCITDGYDGRTLSGGRAQVDSLSGDADTVAESVVLGKYLDGVVASTVVSKRGMPKHTNAQIDDAIDAIEPFLPAKKWPFEIRELLLVRSIKTASNAEEYEKVHAKGCPFLLMGHINLKDITMSALPECSAQQRITFYAKTYWKDTMWVLIHRGEPSMHVVQRLCKWAFARYEAFDPLEAAPEDKVAMREYLDLWGYLEMLLDDTIGAGREDTGHNRITYEISYIILICFIQFR